MAETTDDAVLDLDAIRARLAAVQRSWPTTEQKREFALHAIGDMSVLLREVERLQGELDTERSEKAKPRMEIEP